MNRPRSKSSTADLIGSRLFRGKKHFRVVLLGSTGVGKTCIVSRLLYEKFIQHHKATIEELHSGIFEINGVDVTLELLDTSGLFEFPAMRRLSIMTGDGFILIFAINDKSSFDKIFDLRKEILEVKGDPMIPIVVIGNKTDLLVTSRSLSSDDDDDDCDECGIARKTDNPENRFKNFSINSNEEGNKKSVVLGNTDCKGIGSSDEDCDKTNINDARNKEMVTKQNVLSCNDNFGSGKRGSIFNNGNSALEKCLQELSLRDGKKRKVSVSEMKFISRTATARRKCSEGFQSGLTGRQSSHRDRSQLIINDKAITPSYDILNKQAKSSDESNNKHNHHYHHHQYPECQRRKSHQPDTLHLLSAPRRSLPLHHNHHHHHHCDHRQTYGPENEQGEYNTIDMKVVEDIVSIDWGHGFIQISAKNDSDVSTVIFKALLSEVDVHLQELQCLPPQKTNALDRLFHFRSNRRVSEDTKMRYRRTSCKVS